MASYWLDLVRFADTVGYHGDQDHSITPYRDWVINAFNDGLPFDQFTREQLAGDLLSKPDSRGAHLPDLSILGEEILRDAEELGDGALQLKLAPVQEAGPLPTANNGTTYSIAAAAEVRRSVLTSLRSLAAERGGSLATAIAPDGGHFELTLIVCENGDLLRTLAWNESPNPEASERTGTETLIGSTALAESIPWVAPSKLNYAVRTNAKIPRCTGYIPKDPKSDPYTPFYPGWKRAD